MTDTKLEELTAENTELRRRVEAAEATIDELRAEALERRSEIRAMAEQLPAAMSRHALVRQMLDDARHHPDKAGVARRGARKARREIRRVLGGAARRVRDTGRRLLGRSS